MTRLSVLQHKHERNNNQANTAICLQQGELASTAEDALYLCICIFMSIHQLSITKVILYEFIDIRKARFDGALDTLQAFNNTESHEPISFHS